MDYLDDPAYTDTVKSTDSAGSLLRRSMSVPPQYTYQAPKRKHAKELFSELFGQSKPALPQKAVITVPPDDKDNGKWRQTMEDLIENPEYQDSLESTSSRTGLLARTAVSIARAGREAMTSIIPEETDDMDIEAKNNKEHKKYTKNLMVLSVSFMLVFTAYLALRNLQSSLYPTGGLGLYGLSAVYASIFVGCMFATTIVQRLRPKRVIMLCMVGILVQIVSNYYPSYYTLLPASGIVGFCMANLWTAHATYLTSIALQYSHLTGKNSVHIVSKFNGTFFMFFQLANVLGGIISSTVLMLQAPPANKNITILEDHTSANYSITTMSMSQEEPIPQCGASYCYGSGNAAGKTFVVSKSIVYILLSIFLFFAVVGLIVFTIFLDQLEGIIKRSHSSMKTQMLSVFKLFGDMRMLCITGFMFYSLVQVSFMFGEYTKVKLSCIIPYKIVMFELLSISNRFVIDKVLKLLHTESQIHTFLCMAILHSSHFECMIK